MLTLALLLALQLSWSWAYRGGSLPFKLPRPLNSRPVELLATPLFIAAALATASPPDATLGWLGLALGFVLFYAAQADGWGRQMDLGKNSKPDDETGHQVRDLFFEEKSSFSRDLVGLYMRLAQFLGAGFAWAALYDPIAAAIPLALFLFGPVIWVAEHVFWWRSRPNQAPPFAIVEYGIGALLATVTALVVCLI